MSPRRVLIVDDQAPFRSIARTVVGLTAGFVVVGEAETGEEAVDLAAGAGVDVVLMDINLPGIDGIEATRQIAAHAPQVAVLLLSSYEVGSLPADASTCGAVGYLHKAEFGPAALARLTST